MKKGEYKLDRSLLQSSTAEVANDHTTYWNDTTKSERLNAACFIINQIFGVTPSTKVDVNLINKRKHPNG